MRVLFSILIFTSFLFSEIIIVTNKNSTIEKLPKDYIQYLYLQKIDKIDNNKIIPLVCIEKKLHKEFVNKFLNKSIFQYNSYWARLVFTGRKSMYKKLTKDEIFAKLDNINTIAYIQRADLKDTMKIIYEEK